MKTTNTDTEWIQMMKNLESLRLFSRLVLRKGRRGEKLSAGEMDVLFRVALSKKPLTPGMLSTNMGSSKTIISRFTDNLCKKELIQKQYDRTDGRSYSLVITEKGTNELIHFCHYYLDPLYLLKGQMGQESFEEMLLLIKQANCVLSDEQPNINMKEK